MLNKYTICSFVIVIFHIVGLYGFLMPGWNGLFIKLVPLHLMLMFLLMIISGYDGSVQLKVFAAGVYMAGFLIEVIGVNTGLIFGLYGYGMTLGYKIWDTPLLIGVNWVLLVYTTGILLSAFRLQKYIRVFLGGVILVGIDYLIEPVAVKYDYWTWSQADIPAQNYIGWFFVSLVMFTFYERLNFRKQNKSAVVLFVAQLCFFIILNKWAT